MRLPLANTTSTLSFSLCVRLKLITQLYYYYCRYVTDSDDFCKIIEQAVDNFALDPEQLSGLLINLVNTEAFSRDQRVDFVKDVTLACVDSRKRPFVLDYILFERYC